jgi:general secretion pathway protein G
MREAFTMIELIFVIVILGILASVAIPKLATTRDDAKIVNILQQIKLATAEIQEEAFAKGVIKAPQEMSQVLKQMVYQNKAVISSVSPINGSIGQLTLYTQNGSNSDDHAFIIDMNLTTMVIRHGTPCSGHICRQAQARISEGNYSVGGDRVIF